MSVDVLDHQSLTSGLDVVIPNMIWKVGDLCTSDIDAVHAALCDWNNVAMEEITKTKSIAMRLVFGQCTEGFTGCRFGTNFIKLNRGSECIYIVSNDPLHSSVSIYYGVMPEKLIGLQIAAGSVDWKDFCMIMSFRMM
jgi:hypothetical protein